MKKETRGRPKKEDGLTKDQRHTRTQLLPVITSTDDAEIAEVQEIKERLVEKFGSMRAALRLLDSQNGLDKEKG